MNLALLKEANDGWNSFVASLTPEEKKGLAELDEPIASNKLHYLSTIKDWQTFDQITNGLSKSFLYSQEIIPTVYNSYIDRGLHELAFGYLNDSAQFIKSIGETANSNVQSLIDASITLHLLLNLKSSFGHIRNLKPTDLISIVPDILNDKRVLSEFILNEIVQAARILIEKVHGIKQIKHEDRYNDLLLAILRLRLPIWGWEISDQPRTGHSATGKNAGEVDLLIKGGGNTIALFEALILSRKNKTLTQTHVKKTTNYANFLDSYYMIVYYTGGPSGFDRTWDNYKDDAKETAFPVRYKFDNSKGYEDLAHKFNNVTSLRIAKSYHGTAEFFHIFIDLSR